MLEPRTTPRGTRTDSQWHREFWGHYVRAYHFGGNDEPIGGAEAVFSDIVLNRMRKHIGDEAINTPVLFTDRLSNRVAAGHCERNNGLHIIAINARFKVDPEVLAHTLIEEFAHAQQSIDGVDFAAQKRHFAYAERPYEQQAKQMATEVPGYEPEAHQAYIRREEPLGPLYDRPHV